MNCAIIGSGIAGLATAIRLKLKGVNIDVFEANGSPGGKLQQMQVKGYRFDLGPSVFTMPQLVDELFLLAGKNPRDYFSYTRLDTSFKYYFEDGTCINAFADTALFAKEVAAKTQDSEENFWRYLDDIKLKYEITNEVFIENSLHIFRNYFTGKMLSGVLKFHKIDAFKTMREGNRKFFSDPRMVQIFDHYASYVGSNPLVAPATLNLISHLVLNIGAFIPDHGMYGMVTALVKLAEELGVKLKYNTSIEEIIVKDHRAVGLKLKQGEFIPYDRIVSNVDIYYTYHRLLPSEEKPIRILAQPKSSSVICFYWGVKNLQSSLGLHNMLFTQNETEEYQTIFEEKNICNDPSIYICVTSKHIKEDAPQGSENWFVLITAPHDQNQNWDEIVSRTRKNVLEKIKRMLNIHLESHIEYEDLLTPPLVQQRYGSAFGAVFGNSSNNRFAAFLRHSNFSDKIKGLYFASGSVHPGAGIPMCLNAAKIVDKIFK